MTAQYGWWLLALVLVVAELLTGTFYLLVLALGCAAGGVAAFAGLGSAGQLLAAAVTTVVGWFGVRRWRPQRSPGESADSNRDVLLDIGERVRIEQWQPDGRARVHYRGAAWSAELAAGEPAAAAGEYVIRRVEGNRLIVAAAPAAASRNP